MQGLQRPSKRSNHSTVSTVLEEALRVTSADRRDRLSHRLHQSLAGSSLGFAQETLDLGEGFFDGVEVRRVGRQVRESWAPRSSTSARTLSLPCELKGCPSRRPARLANYSGRASSRHKPRTPRGRWRPPPPGTVPYPRPSCSKATWWCSVPGCEAPNNKPFAQVATRRAAPTQ
jgi:hypothetical protein